jgi:hypothetical protein
MGRDFTYIWRRNSFSKGGDPVSHCHYLRTSKAATWILASGEVSAA